MSPLQQKMNFLHQLEEIKSTCTILSEQLTYLKEDLSKNPDKKLYVALDELCNNIGNDHIYITAILHEYSLRVLS